MISFTVIYFLSTAKEQFSGQRTFTNTKGDGQDKMIKIGSQNQNV